MKHWCLLALAGCDAVFGIQKTKALPHADAQQFDGIPDAPFACPSSGPPTFSVFFRQVVPQGGCILYTVGGGIALASCPSAPDSANYDVRESPADSPTMTNITPTGLSSPVLSTDGTELWVGHLDSIGGRGVLSVYVPDGANSWLYSYDAFSMPGLYVVADSAMPQGSPRHALFDAGGMTYEIAEGPPHVWSQVASFVLLPTPATVSSPPQMTPDGLRVVFAGGSGPTGQAVWFASRASLSDSFGTAVPITGPPEMAQYPFMTGDCSRLYFSGLGSVFYVPQQLP